MSKVVRPALVILGGLPGVGKTTLARRLAVLMAAVYLRIDSIEQALAESSLSIKPAEDAGYMAAYALARDNLHLGRKVIADSVNPIEVTRSAWRDVAARCECPFVEVEMTCSDLDEHRHRVENRTSGIAGLQLPNWQKVVDRDYEPWPGDRICIDTAGRTVEESVEQLWVQLLKSPDLRASLTVDQADGVLA